MNPTGIETPPSSELAASRRQLVRAGNVEGAGRISSEPAREPQFLLCEHCHAPVDRDQRYCVRCGARQSHARNPATSYFAAAARNRRSGPPRARTEGGLRGPLFALFLVLLPLGVAIGVLVGRSGSGTNDKLLSALRQPVVVPQQGAAPAAAAAAAAGTTPSGNLPSDFSLPRGFAVKLSTLPLRGTDQAAATKAEQEARAKGAAQVGLINPKDFKTKPDQGSSSYVVYSGQFKTRAQAQTALAKLKARFPGAAVIEVSPVGSAASAAPVVAHTEFGTVHQLAGSRVTPKQVQEDKKVVQKINRTVGKSYVEAQKGLPDVIAVGGGSGEASSPNQSAAEKLGEK